MESGVTESPFAIITQLPFSKSLTATSPRDFQRATDGLRSRRLQVRILPGILVLADKGLAIPSLSRKSLLFWIDRRPIGSRSILSSHEYAGRVNGSGPFHRGLSAIWSRSSGVVNADGDVTVRHQPRPLATAPPKSTGDAASQEHTCSDAVPTWVGFVFLDRPSAPVANGYWFVPYSS